MRCQPECYACLENLARRCVSLAAADSQTHEQALAAALVYLENNFSPDSISTGLAAEMQRIIRLKTGNDDPFAAVKRDEIALALRCTERFPLPAQDSLPELVRFAARGNGFDFFQDLQMLEKEFQEPVVLARDDVAALEKMLQHFRTEGDKKVVYLADNAGECLFDLPLLKFLEQSATVYYAVKESPVQNDLSPADLEQSGLIESFSNVITTGTDSPGLDLVAVSVSFKKLLDQADLIVAKGMGHYETLPELSLPQPVFLIFKVKCNPIAQHSGMLQNSYAAYFLE